MLWWAIMFFVVALVAALFGFTEIATGSAALAQVIFAVFLVLTVASFVIGLTRHDHV